MIEHTLDEEKRLCPNGHGFIHVIGKEVTREITVIPAKTYGIEHIQYKYACDPCQEQGIKTSVKADPISKRAISESDSTCRCDHGTSVTGIREEGHFEILHVALSDGEIYCSSDRMV